MTEMARKKSKFNPHKLTKNLVVCRTQIKITTPHSQQNFLSNSIQLNKCAYRLADQQAPEQLITCSKHKKTHDADVIL